MIAEQLGAVARRDRQAFAALYRGTSPKLFAVILRIMKQHSLAEEVLQEVYIKVWDKAAGFRPERGSPNAWLITLARNSAIDRLRREGRAPRTTELPEDSLWQDEGPDPLDQAMAREESRAIRHCLGKLPEAQRRSLLLAYCDGYTQEEISGLLERPLGTVKSWIRRGQVLLKKCLER